MKLIDIITNKKLKVFIVVSNYQSASGIYDIIPKIFRNRELAEAWLGDNDNYTIVEREFEL
jgi:hypothetical protein